MGRPRIEARGVADATPDATSTARGAETTRIPRRLTGRSAVRQGCRRKAKLCHMGQLMTQNRQGPIVNARLTEANGTAECAIALDKTSTLRQTSSAAC